MLFSLILASGELRHTQNFLHSRILSAFNQKKILKFGFLYLQVYFIIAVQSDYASYNPLRILFHTKKYLFILLCQFFVVSHF